MERNADWTELVAERKIQEAMEAGEFDNLPGKGQPLDLDVNPFEPIHLRVANRVLRNARALPEWLQLEKDIEREAALLTSTKTRAPTAARQARTAASRSRLRERFREQHRERLDLLNLLVLKYNLIVPDGARRTFLTYNIQKELAALDDEFTAP